MEKPAIGWLAVACRTRSVALEIRLIFSCGRPMWLNDDDDVVRKSSSLMATVLHLFKEINKPEWLIIYQIVTRSALDWSSIHQKILTVAARNNRSFT